MKTLFLAAFVSCICIAVHAQDIKLPTPSKTGGKPLMEALSQRKSIKEFTGKELDKQTLSNLLWAAYGFNRADKRTVPSSQNRQEIDVYVMFKTGIYLYDAKTNILKLHAKGDFVEALGQPNISTTAALTLIYVVNQDKASGREAGFIDTGFIAQNVYLYAASANLGTVARASFNKKTLPEAMKLNSKQEITLVQAVGIPK